MIKKNIKTNKIQPVIKWTGSKRRLAQEIISYFPKQIDTYYEPFVGGGSIFLSLITNENFKINKFVLSDINNDLINLWLDIKNNPQKLIYEYQKNWNEFNNLNNDIQHRKDTYNIIRKNFNTYHNTSDFLFLTRTSINGLIRYNKKNEFNAPPHFTRPGIEPKKLEKIILTYNDILNKKDVIFKNSNYSEIKSLNEYDLIYLDPPYANGDNLYYGKINYEKFFEWVLTLKCNKFLSLDGKTDLNDYTYDLPKELIKKHIYLEGKNSSYNNLNNVINKVYESFYIIT